MLKEWSEGLKLCWYKFNSLSFYSNAFTIWSMEHYRGIKARKKIFYISAPDK